MDLAKPVSPFWMLFELRVDGDGGDNWSYKSCKAPLILPLPTNQHPTFCRLDALPVAQPTVTEHRRDLRMQLIITVVEKVMFSAALVSVFVCLFVIRITQKLFIQLSQNSMESWHMGHR